MTYVKQSGESNGDAGDPYTGLDRFGRIVDQRWITTATGTAVDRYQYTYDRDGNVTAKTNALASAYSETYTYDSLNRLNGTSRNGAAYQSWTLDPLGNATSITTDGTAQSRSVNSQNELTTVGSSTLVFDSNGNTTTDEQGHTLTYDAWNRLAAVKDGSGNLLQAYRYDGLGRRILETPASGAATELYYTAHWQVLEERQAGRATAQYLWSPVYVNALILRDANADGNRLTGSYGQAGSGLEQRLYVLQDANFNVTALTTVTGVVVERYVYDAYGKVTVKDASWGTRSVSSYGWVYLYQGGRQATATGIYAFQQRDYSPTMMRWMEAEPSGAGYVDGSNLYQGFGGNPINGVDPTGLVEITNDDLLYSAATGFGGGVPGSMSPEQRARERESIPSGGVYVPRDDSFATSVDIVEEFLFELGKDRKFHQNDFMTTVLRDSSSMSYWRGVALNQAKKGNFETVRIEQHNSQGDGFFRTSYSVLWDYSHLTAAYLTGGSFGNMGYIGSYDGFIEMKKLEGCKVELSFQVHNATTTKSAWPIPVGRHPAKTQNWDWKETIELNQVSPLVSHNQGHSH